MRHTVGRGKRVLALLVVGGLAAGCGTLDTAQLEELIAQRLTEDIGITATTVSCPKDIAPKAGATFECTATGADGSSARIAARQADDSGRVQIEANLLKTKLLEQSISKQVGDRIGVEGVAVDCPDLVPIEPGKELQCDATGGSEHATVVVTIQNDNGDVTFRTQE